MRTFLILALLLAFAVSINAAEAKDAWDVLDQAAGSVQAPADWAAEHDHYLYGSPKRGKEGQ